MSSYNWEGAILLTSTFAGIVFYLNYQLNLTLTQIFVNWKCQTLCSWCLVRLKLYSKIPLLARTTLSCGRRPPFRTAQHPAGAGTWWLVRSAGTSWPRTKWSRTCATQSQSRCQEWLPATNRLVRQGKKITSLYFSYSNWLLINDLSWLNN